MFPTHTISSSLASPCREYLLSILPIHTIPPHSLHLVMNTFYWCSPYTRFPHLLHLVMNTPYRFFPYTRFPRHLLHLVMNPYFFFPVHTIASSHSTPYHEYFLLILPVHATSSSLKSPYHEYFLSILPVHTISSSLYAPYHEYLYAISLPQLFIIFSAWWMMQVSLIFSHTLIDSAPLLHPVMWCAMLIMTDAIQIQSSATAPRSALRSVIR